MKVSVPATAEFGKRIAGLYVMSKRESRRCVVRSGGAGLRRSASCSCGRLRGRWAMVRPLRVQNGSVAGGLLCGLPLPKAVCSNYDESRWRADHLELLLLKRRASRLFRHQDQ